MAVLQASDITDLANLTLKKYGRRKITEVAADSDITEYVALEQIIKQKRVMYSSTDIAWELLLNGGDNAATVSYTHLRAHET